MAALVRCAAICNVLKSQGLRPAAMPMLRPAATLMVTTSIRSRCPSCPIRRYAASATSERRRGNIGVSAFDNPEMVRTMPEPGVEPGWRPVQRLTPMRLASVYAALSKPRLTSLVVLTAMAGYAVCPADAGVLSSAAAAFAESLPASLPSFGSPAAPQQTTIQTLLALATGTWLCSASANAWNQLREAPYDAQMARTRNRVMPTRAISPLHAAGFTAATGVLGVGTLAILVNPIVATLGGLNAVLYASVYTSMKRTTVLNTWVGSLVGAIPPLMGWAAASPDGASLAHPGAWALAGVLFAWQFLHFNAVAHSIRLSYALAGYRMLASIDPAWNARVALRYTLALIPLCSLALPYAGVTTWAFATWSLVPNLALTWTAAGFWRAAAGSARDDAARTLFYASLVHLPILLVLMMICKQPLELSDADLTRIEGVEADSRTPGEPRQISLPGMEIARIGAGTEADERSHSPDELLRRRTDGRRLV